MIKVIFALLTYTVIGATIFQQLDRKTAQLTDQQLIEKCTSTILQKLSKNSQSKLAVTAGLKACLSQASDSESQSDYWTVHEALRLVLHVYTTTGYGNVTPTSKI